MFDWLATRYHHSRQTKLTLETFKAVYRNVVVSDSAVTLSNLHSQIISFGCPTLNYGISYCNALLYDFSMLTDTQFITDQVSRTQIGYLGTSSTQDAKDPSRMGDMGLWF